MKWTPPPALREADVVGGVYRPLFGEEESCKQ